MTAKIKSAGNTHAGLSVDGVCDFPDWTDGPGDIRGMWTSHQPRPIGQQGLQLGHVAGGILGIGRRPPLDSQAKYPRDPDPRGSIGFMVELGQNQLVPSLKLDCRGEIVQKLGG